MAQTIEDLERKMKAKNGVIKSLTETIGEAHTEVSELKDRLKEEEEERVLLEKKIKAIKANWSDDRGMKEDLEMFANFNDNRKMVQESGALGKGNCGDQIDALLSPFSSTVRKCCPTLRAPQHASTPWAHVLPREQRLPRRRHLLPRCPGLL